MTSKLPQLPTPPDGGAVFFGSPIAVDRVGLDDRDAVGLAEAQKVALATPVATTQQHDPRHAPAEAEETVEPAVVEESADIVALDAGRQRLNDEAAAERVKLEKATAAWRAKQDEVDAAGREVEAVRHARRRAADATVLAGGYPQMVAWQGYAGKAREEFSRALLEAPFIGALVQHLVGLAVADHWDRISANANTALTGAPAYNAYRSQQIEPERLLTLLADAVNAEVSRTVAVRDAEISAALSAFVDGKSDQVDLPVVTR
jgi:hypothetical protein